MWWSYWIHWNEALWVMNAHAACPFWNKRCQMCGHSAHSIEIENHKRNINRLRGYSESNMARANTAWCKRKQNSSNKKNTTYSTTCLPVFAILAIDCQALMDQLDQLKTHENSLDAHSKAHEFAGVDASNLVLFQHGHIFFTLFQHLFDAKEKVQICLKIKNIFPQKMRKFLSVEWPSIHLSHLFLARIPVPKSWNHLAAGSQRHSWGTANCQHHQHTLGV